VGAVAAGAGEAWGNQLRGGAGPAAAAARAAAAGAGSEGAAAAAAGVAGVAGSGGGGDAEEADTAAASSVAPALDTSAVADDDGTAKTATAAAPVKAGQCRLTR